MEYVRRTGKNKEMVAKDIFHEDGTYQTTCVIDVALLLCGYDIFPCGDGDDKKLSSDQILEILEFVLAERKKIAAKESIKTRDGWFNSGLAEFSDYFHPGDTVKEDVVGHFVNCVPPVTQRSTCAQCGEAWGNAVDENGRSQSVYITFHRLPDGNWKFDGYCFSGRNENRLEYASYLEKQIAERKASKKF